ncbi:MAG: heme biosynthesis protein HemY [Gallionella sp.]|jgi:HemY protein|nr:heme biosynthesis protein HemY [Gallionella sp.]
MKYLLWLLVLFAAAVAVTTAAHNSAYVLLVYPPYRIDMSLTLFVCLILLLLLAGYSMIRLAMMAVTLPTYARRFREQRDHAKSQALLNDALNAYFEGRYAAAERAAVHAMALGDTTSLHPILAASSAHELREFDKRDQYLAMAEGKDAGDATMRLMATTKFMLDQRDPQAALAALEKLRASGVKSHLGALSLELKAQQQAGHWDEVLDIVKELEKRAAIDVTVAAQLRQQAYLESLRAQQSAGDVAACLKKIPAEFRRRGKVAAAAARALIQYGDGVLAQQILADSLNAQWDSELVALYGDCQTGDAVAQIEQAEKWLNQHRQDAGLLLALGKLCTQQKLWGKAQNYLDASVSVSPSHAAYTALGQLAERLGKSEETYRYYQQAMELKK